MTEQVTNHELHARHHVYAIMSRYQDQAFEALDKLHQRGIHDNDVIKALRDGDYRSEADAYIEWAGAIDPDVDPTPAGPELVTDPCDSDSNRLMRSTLEAAGGIRVTASISFGGPAIELGRDADGGQWIRPIGGVWVGVVEK